MITKVMNSFIAGVDCGLENDIGNDDGDIAMYDGTVGKSPLSGAVCPYSPRRPSWQGKEQFHTS